MRVAAGNNIVLLFSLGINNTFLFGVLYTTVVLLLFLSERVLYLALAERQINNCDNRIF